MTGVHVAPPVGQIVKSSSMPSNMKHHVVQNYHDVKQPSIVTQWVNSADKSRVIRNPLAAVTRRNNKYVQLSSTLFGDSGSREQIRRRSDETFRQQLAEGFNARRSSILRDEREQSRIYDAMSVPHEGLPVGQYPGSNLIQRRHSLPPLQRLPMAYEGMRGSSFDLAPADPYDYPYQNLPKVEKFQHYKYTSDQVDDIEKQLRTEEELLRERRNEELNAERQRYRYVQQRKNQIEDDAIESNYKRQQHNIDRELQREREKIRRQEQLRNKTIPEQVQRDWARQLHIKTAKPSFEDTQNMFYKHKKVTAESLNRPMQKKTARDKTKNLPTAKQNKLTTTKSDNWQSALPEAYLNMKNKDNDDDNKALAYRENGEMSQNLVVEEGKWRTKKEREQLGSSSKVKEKRFSKSKAFITGNGDESAEDSGDAEEENADDAEDVDGGVEVQSDTSHRTSRTASSTSEEFKLPKLEHVSVQTGDSLKSEQLRLTLPPVIDAAIQTGDTIRKLNLQSNSTETQTEDASSTEISSEMPHEIPENEQTRVHPEVHKEKSQGNKMERDKRLNTKIKTSFRRQTKDDFDKSKQLESVKTEVVSHISAIKRKLKMRSRKADKERTETTEEKPLLINRLTRKKDVHRKTTISVDKPPSQSSKKYMKRKHINLEETNRTLLSNFVRKATETP